MKDDAVVEALTRQLLDAGDVLGREIGPQLDHDAAILQIHIKGILEVLRLGGASG